MTDGREILPGHTIPIASGVTASRYCFPTSRVYQRERAKLRLLCAGRETCLPAYHVERTEFQCRLIELVVAGRGHIRINGKTHDIFPGIVFGYGMDSQHEMWSSAEDPMTKYFAAFESGESPDSIAALEKQTEIRWTRDLSAMQVLFDELIREGQRDGELHQKITSAYLELVLLKMAESLPDHRIPNRNESKGRDVFERALVCIETDYCEISTLDELSRKVGVDPNYICRLFKRYGHETPIQCLSRYKLNYAAELLLSQSRSVAEVASTVGYSDPFYFSKVFKKRFGRSPSAFRGSSQDTTDKEQSK